MGELDILAMKAKDDENTINELVTQYENFILRCTSAAARKYISKSDDEWSIALAAFTEAIRSYSSEKGSFLNFAELVIRRRIIDYVRSKSRYSSEILVKPSLFESETEEEGDYGMQSEIAKKVSAEDDNSLKMEIHLINEVFSEYGFSFMDLTECSPKAEKTKRSCAKAVVFIIKNPILISEMKIKRQLQLNLIERNTKVPRKLLERHRKYIIAAVEIMSGDYPHLAGYMRYISEELKNEGSNS